MNYFKLAVASLTGGLLALIITLPVAIKFLLLFMALDYLSGVIAGFRSKQLSSDVGFHGLQKKALVIILVATAHLITHATEIGYDLGSAVAIAYTVNEFMSIIENCNRAGVWIPGILLEAMEKLRKSGAYSGPERRLHANQLNGKDAPK